MTVQLPELTPEQLAEAARLHLAANPPKPPEGQDEASLPEWARAAIKRGNDEAASYRTQLREAQGKLAEAKTPEDIAAATKEWQEKFEASEKQRVETELSAARTLAQTTLGLTELQASRLVGTNADEITADAKAFATDLGLINPDGTPVPPKRERRQRTPGGGLDGGGAGGGTEKYDPAALAAEVEKASGQHR